MEDPAELPWLPPEFGSCGRGRIQVSLLQIKLTEGNETAAPETGVDHLGEQRERSVLDNVDGGMYGSPEGPLTIFVFFVSCSLLLNFFSFHFSNFGFCFLLFGFYFVILLLFLLILFLFFKFFSVFFFFFFQIKTKKKLYIYKQKE